ncbi:MAG: DUF1311 domain-containing protein [Burkholderiales bacterium]|nr:DUF1311 domain-containing protein [Burkholderiales bacterium]
MPDLSRRALLCLLSAALAAPQLACALDDPDAPDRVAAFVARARDHEQAVINAEHDAEGLAAAAAYAKFLDRELNTAYQQLLARVPADARRELIRSQRRWLEFRDAEVQFIDANWTPAQFGSSSALSRSGYRNSLVKQRVLTLLDYMRNYGDGKP